MKMAKTFSQHVVKRSETKVDKVVAAKVQQQYKHECEYCGRRFKLKKSVAIHQRSCVHFYDTTEKYYVVEDIIGAFGHIPNCWYLVRWEGYEEPEWERTRGRWVSRGDSLVLGKEWFVTEQGDVCRSTWEAQV